MKSFFNLLNKRAGGGVLSIVLLIFLVAGCSNASGGDSSDNNTSDVPYNLSVRTAYATWVEINFCTVEEMEALRYYSYKLYKGEETEPVTEDGYNSEASDYYQRISGSGYSSTKGLIPDTEYTIKVEYTTSDYKTIKKELKFKTKPYDFSDYTLGYDDIYKAVRITSEELNIGSVTAWRSDKADGEYIEVKLKTNNSNYVDVYDDNNLENNKTYYYKFAVKKYNSETGAYDVLYKSTEPKAITLGKLAPKAVDEDSIKIHQGITRVKFEWDAVKDATKYKVSVQPYSTYLSEPALVEEEVTDTVYEFNALKYIEDFTTYSSIHYRDYKISITAVNEVGNSDSIYRKFNIDDIKITSVAVSAGQKEAVYRIKTNFDYVAPDCTVEYILNSKYSEAEINDENLLAPISSSPEIIRRDLKIFTEYYSNPASGYAFVRVTYKDKDGNDIKSSKYKSVDRFKTGEFDTVTDLEVLEVKSTSIKIKFTGLSAEQKDGQNVYYWVMANDKAPVKITNPDGAVIEGLEAGINYSLKVIATNDSYVTSSDFYVYGNYAEIEAATDSGLSKPTNVTLSEEEGTLDTQPLLKVTWDKITEDDGSGNVAYEVEFKILKKSSFRKFTHKVGNDYVNAYTNIYEATMPVNAGNRYFARVVAYKVDEPACKVYSDTKEIQFQKYDDRTLVTALTYPANVGNHKVGDVIDFTDPNVWEGENFVPRSSTTTGYNFGITQFMGEASNEKIRIPTGNPAYFAFKVSLDAEDDADKQGINSTYTPRLIFIDEYAFFTAADRQGFGCFGNIFIVIPETDGHILKEFPEPDGYLFSSVNMPYFNRETDGSLKSTTSAASAGIAVDESWIYNNSVYVGVKQTVSGNVGFSYFY